MTFTPEEVRAFERRSETVETEHGTATIVAGPAQVEPLPGQRSETVETEHGAATIVAGPAQVESVPGQRSETVETEHGTVTISAGPAVVEAGVVDELVRRGLTRQEAAELSPDHPLYTATGEYLRLWDQHLQIGADLATYRMYRYFIENARPVQPSNAGIGYSSPQYQNWDIGLAGVAPNVAGVGQEELGNRLLQTAGKRAFSMAAGAGAGRAGPAIFTNMSRQVASTVASGILSIGLLSVSGAIQISHDVMMADAVQAFSKPADSRTGAEWEAITDFREYIADELDDELPETTRELIGRGAAAAEQREDLLEEMEAANQRVHELLEAHIGGPVHTGPSISAMD